MLFLILTKWCSELATYQSHDNTRMRRMGGDMHPGANPLAQMGPAMMSGGGKVGSLSFEHVLSKLQVSCFASSRIRTLLSRMSNNRPNYTQAKKPAQNCKIWQLRLLASKIPSVAASHLPRMAPLSSTSLPSFDQQLRKLKLLSQVLMGKKRLLS